MRYIVQHKHFRRDYKMQKRRGKKMEKLEEVVRLLLEEDNLPPKHRPHKLSGEWRGFWECHIESDWLLIYGLTETKVLLVRTGTHADLFE